MLRTVGLNNLNPNITCPLCGGYFVEATTIMECLHSFCRSCIVKYLETSFNCPVCQTEIHKTRPLLHVRPDPVLQDLVYKLVPCLYDDYQKEKQDFEKRVASETLEVDEQNEGFDIPYLLDPIYVTLEQRQRNKNKNEQVKVFPIRYLRCSSAMPVRILKRFLTMKFFVKESQQIEVTRSDEVLFDYLTLKEVARIYGRYGKLAPLDLYFDVVPKDRNEHTESLEIDATSYSDNFEGNTEKQRNTNEDNTMNKTKNNTCLPNDNVFPNTPETDPLNKPTLLLGVRHS